MEPHNALKEIQRRGQSICIDYTRRDLIANGELRRMINEDAVTGMTSNPAIFEKAIAGSDLYDEEIKEMGFHGRAPIAIYEALGRADLQQAADEFRSIFDATDGNDGFVSLEVNPHLAHETKGTVVEARRLWRALDRPNTFIKVPATAEGIPAIQQLVSDGINVNITLLFGLRRYEQVIEAYIAGVKDRVAQGKDVRNVASVASFFLSRIDAKIDPLLDEIRDENSHRSQLASELRGRAAIASAAAAYDTQRKVFGSDTFERLAARGARPQKLLWASTSAKDPFYDELKYVESLIARDTITTLTPETLAAYKQQGNASGTFEAVAPDYEALEGRLSELGIDIRAVAEELEAEGVAKFTAAFDKLIAAIKEKSQQNQAITIEEKGYIHDAQH